MGSPPIGTSTITFTSSGGASPIEIAEIFISGSRRLTVLDQLCDHGWIGERRDIAKRIHLVFGDLAQNSPHDLARTSFVQPRRELDDVGCSDRPDFLAYPGD